MTQLRRTPDIEVRHCATLAEYDECVRVEHLTWGAEIAVPSAIFVVAQHTGGQVLGAFSAGQMVGFTLALVGVRAGRPFFHSHMTAVLPGHQNQGVGRRLKLFQRQDALKRGIDLGEWTFDPRELKNARFNLIRPGRDGRRTPLGRLRLDGRLDAEGDRERRAGGVAYRGPEGVGEGAPVHSAWEVVGNTGTRPPLAGPPALPPADPVV